MADPDFADQMMNDIKDLIPKTPEESRAASRANPVGQWFEDFSSGNMFERIHGFEGTESLYVGLVDKKGGSDLVAPKSYLGAIAQFIRAMFSYGDDSLKDEDPIYNTREGNPDIDTGGSSTPSTTSLEGSVLYTRVENIFKYYSSKTKWMISETDGLRELLERLETQLQGFQQQNQEDKQGQEEKNEEVGTNLEKLTKDLSDATARINEVEKQIAAIIPFQAQMFQDIKAIKTFVGMP